MVLAVRALLMLAACRGDSVILFAPWALPGAAQQARIAQALRATLAVLVLMAFYAPKFGTPRGAFVGLIVSVIATIGCFLAGNPYGIDSSYLALAGPLLTMGISQLFKSAHGQTSPVR